MPRRILILLLGLTLLIAPAAASAKNKPSGGVPGPDPVVTWNATAAAAALAVGIAPTDDPLHESRMYAMMHVAIHDALNAIDRRSDPYVFDGTADAGASVNAAVAAAARDVLVTTIGQIPAPFDAAHIALGVAVVEAAYGLALGAVPSGQAKTAGIAVGQASAAAIIQLRTGDGSTTPLIVDSYVQGTQPGEYRFTPGTPFAFAPGWGDVTPFALNDASQFRPGPPYDLTSHRYAEDLNEVQRLGGDGVITPSERTPEQTEIARFWVESSPLMWNRIARAVSTAEGLDPWDSARLFGLLNIALTDGYIDTFETKYYYRFWRPVTAIQLAHTDGNPWTQVNPTWTPLVGTPPIPDYDSGHSVEGGAAAQVLSRFFHTDKMSFSTCSFTLPAGQTCLDASPTIRHFTRFSQAMDENGVSRIYVGFHFRDAVTTGIKHGEKIGDWTVKEVMRPGH